MSALSMVPFALVTMPSIRDCSSVSWSSVASGEAIYTSSYCFCAAIRPPSGLNVPPSLITPSLAASRCRATADKEDASPNRCCVEDPHGLLDAVAREALDGVCGLDDRIVHDRPEIRW